MADKTELNFPMKKVRQPKVIIFEEPGRNKQEKKIIRKRQLPPKRDDSESDDEDFISIAREVKEFGATGFTRKEQKKNKQKYAEHLGAKKQKQQKVPYPSLIERNKRKKENETKTRELERAMGVFKKKRKNNDDVKLSSKLNLGRWVDKSSLGKISGNDTRIKVNKSAVFKPSKR